jgi:cytochrome c oxidase cbb3-type subunit 3
MTRVWTLLLATLAMGASSAWAAQAPLSPKEGATLYWRNCAACHGEDGSGGIGVPLSLPSFQATVDDAYLRKTIRLGRTGRVMPAFTQLSDAEVDAIIKHLRTWHKGPAPVYDARPIKGDAAKGAKLFGKYCAGCHGAAGEGSHGTGVTFSRPRDFPIMPPALRNPGYLASVSDAQIKATLIKGRQGTPMVSFVKRGLRERDIDDVVAFVRSLQTRSIAKEEKVLEAGEPVFVVESSYDLATTIENVKRAATSNNFVFIREQTLDAGIAPEGKENPRQHIVYFCNFGMLNQALAMDPRVGLFLPCRITIVEREGKVSMMTVNPKRLSAIFNNTELNEMCDQMTKQYLAIMEEAAL